MITRNRSAKLISENMFRLVTAKYGLAVIVINCQWKAIKSELKSMERSCTPKTMHICK